MPEPAAVELCGDGHRRLTPALLVGTGRIDDHPLRVVVAFEDLGLAGELQLHRPHPYADRAGVRLVTPVIGLHVGQLRAGQAGGHLRDVAEELPDLVQGLRPRRTGS